MIIWLASYPRSGNTYFRILLHHYYEIPTYTIYPSNLPSVSKLTGYQTLPMSLEEMQASNEIFFVKTHELPCDNLPAIYLVRDGRDALVSYTKFIQNFSLGESYQNPSEILQELIISDSYFGGWGNHVLAWISRPAPITIIKFEDLISCTNPLPLLQSKLEQLNCKLLLKVNTYPPNFEQLQKIEPNFFVKGKIGSWIDTMTSEMHKLFWQRYEQAMQEMGYPYDSKLIFKNCEKPLKNIPGNRQIQISSKEVNIQSKQKYLQILNKYSEIFYGFILANLSLFKQKLLKHHSGFNQHIDFKKTTVIDEKWLHEKQTKFKYWLHGELTKQQIYLVGSDTPIEVVDIEKWFSRAFDILLAEEITIKTQQNNVNYRSLSQSIQPLVSIITSLYKGGEYIDYFLEHITQQTIFKDDCELIIVNAASPEGENKIIRKYQKKFDNILLINLDKTISIYEAWNLAIESSHGKFITNANVDDVRRNDCLEVQAQYLLKKPHIDVVYSDVFYSFIANLPFRVSAQCRLKTNLPIANKFNLLKFNSPHNAPMWRRELHQRIGYFDTSYQSVADHDFWIRASLEGTKFYKIDEPIVSYFYNPEGFSTRINSRGFIEGSKLVNFYKNFYSAKFFLEQKDIDNKLFIPAELFQTKLEGYETDFTITDTHIFYGPYICLPVGCYQVVFLISLKNLDTQLITSSISFDVVQNQDIVCIKHLNNCDRQVLADGKIMLIFMVSCANAQIEFRIHTSGKPFHGSLIFDGVLIENFSGSHIAQQKASITQFS